MLFFYYLNAQGQLMQFRHLSKMPLRCFPNKWFQSCFTRKRPWGQTMTYYEIRSHWLGMSWSPLEQKLEYVYRSQTRMEIMFSKFIQMKLDQIWTQAKKKIFNPLFWLNVPIINDLLKSLNRLRFKEIKILRFVTF